MAELSVERLRSILHYDPDTGCFRWLVSPRNGIPVGAVAGTLNPNGYRQIFIDYKAHKEHRLAFFYMTGRWPTEAVDHRDGAKDNNRWANLREATRQQNSHNIGLRKDNTAGVRGVSWRRREQKWAAYITDPATKRRRWIGEFKDKSNAIEARRAAEIELFGEFRHGNAV